MLFFNYLQNLINQRRPQTHRELTRRKFKHELVAINHSEFSPKLQNMEFVADLMPEITHQDVIFNLLQRRA